MGKALRWDPAPWSNSCCVTAASIAPLPKTGKSPRSYYAVTSPLHQDSADVAAFVGWLHAQAAPRSGKLKTLP